ncbi:MAG: DNA primase [Deltaproteobacteria bacterium]|nr:DNA primase [Deltaproteobacteria bacterium]
MGRIPEETVREVRDRVDIVDLIGRYVDLRKAGRNHKGLCPFHDEKTPSFNVNPDRQAFYCFGCQEGGSAFTFLMKHENLSFPEAVRVLARECGIEIPETSGGDSGSSEPLFEANRIAHQLYRDALATAEAAPARDYLEGRGIDDELIERFEIGYAPNRWDTVAGVLAREGIPARVGETVGLLARRDSGGHSGGHYDRLRGRVVFPICDVRGRCLGFGGRAIFDDQEPKYLNTPETPIFHKREALYGFPLALEGIRRSGRVIVCEGYFDRIALHRAGLPEAVATCGTALTDGHGRELRRRSGQIVLLFDGDEAGQNAMEKALDTLLPTGLRVRAALLAPGEDPDSFLQERGAPALATLVDKAPDALEVVIQRALRGGCSTPSEKSAAVGHAAPFIARIENPVERSAYTRRLALATDSDDGAVDTIVRGFLAKLRVAAARGQQGRQPAASVAHESAGSAPYKTAPYKTAAGADKTAADAHKTAAGAGRGPAGTEGAERKLAELAQLLFKKPALVTLEVRERIEEILPDGSWKSILRHLMAAALDGRVDRSGAIDLLHVEGELDAEAGARLHEIAVSELFEEIESSPDAILEDHLGWFAKQRRVAASRDLRRKLSDPQADVDALLAERQRQLEEKRTAHGIATEPVP